MHNDLFAQKLGFKDYNELLLFEDVCAHSLDFSKEYDAEISNDSSIHFNHSKEKCISFIKKANLTKLFNDVKNLSVVDRLIQIYLYYHNLHIIFDTAAINNKNEFIKDLGVLPSINPNEFLETHEQLGNIALITVDAMDYILMQAKSRLNKEELAIFNEATKEARKTLEEYEIKSFGI